MLPAVWTGPLGLSKRQVCIYAPAEPAGLGGRIPLVYRDKPLPSLRQFVGKECAELPEGIVVGGLCQMQGPGHPLVVDVLHANHIILACQTGALLVLPVLPAVADLLVRTGHSDLLFAVVHAASGHLRQLALFPGEAPLCMAVEVRHIRSVALTVYIEVGTGVVQAEGVADI